MNSTTNAPAPKYNRLKILGIILTLGGIALFGYFIYAVGFREIIDGISRFGSAGFAVILTIYFVRICARAFAWKLCIQTPNKLGMADTVPAVIIGEAMSSTVPLGILISGTAKAIAVKRRVPLVVGLSSVATENLFYSLITGFFLITGAVLLLATTALDASLSLTLYVMVGTLIVLTILGLLMVIRQWHFASWLCNWVYSIGLLRGILNNGRHEVRRFEDLIYGFYRKYPGRFVPICLLEASFHVLGVMETWFILSRIDSSLPGLTTAFLLESVSRLLTVLFKMIPFNIGVDEAGAQFVGDAIALAAGVGVTLAIIRKGRIVFWTMVGLVLALSRGISFRELASRHISHRS
ncbi:MAG: lysylphosphatidylglycerol synthase domain-containing protein [Pyrinomonadaceae bacterium]